jgi:hypothetical protein
LIFFLSLGAALKFSPNCKLESEPSFHRHETVESNLALSKRMCHFEDGRMKTGKDAPGDSKTATNGRKQKTCFLKYNLGETLEIHITGKNMEKRQNFDSTTPPPHT